MHRVKCIWCKSPKKRTTPVKARMVRKIPMEIKLTFLLSLQALQSELPSLEDGPLLSETPFFLLEFLTGKL